MFKDSNDTVAREPYHSTLLRRSLVDLVCYPRFASNEHKAAVEVLERVGLTHVVERWGLDESPDGPSADFFLSL